MPVLIAACERRERCRPIVDDLFSSPRSEIAERPLLPSNPFTAAANAALEREIRPITLGRTKRLSGWTEIGAECPGTCQSLLGTHRLRCVGPCT